jgi:uncharacterized tellurite resistance protein B-like protein
MANSNWENFYKHLGILCFAVASADKKITAAETDRFIEIITEHWKNLEDSTDEFGTDAVFAAESVFDWQIESFVTAEEAYNTFCQYATDNKSMYTPTVKIKLLQTAEAIASAFAGKNKSELVLLSRLQEFLKKL